MRVVEIVVEVPTRLLPRAEAASWALGAQGLELRDEDGGAPRGKRQVVVWMPASTRRAATGALRDALGEAATLRARLVEATWLVAGPPRPIGAAFVVDTRAPGRAPRTRDDAGRHVLSLDASLTFGDGVHPTTVLCVEAIERRFAARAPRTVLDVGTGTGILALVAERLGAERIVATDVDPLARATARVNVAAHHAVIPVRTALPRGRFDLVVANLYLEPLVALAEELVARTERTLVVSGFTDAARVEHAFETFGLVCRDRRERDGWYCLAFEPLKRGRRRPSVRTTPAGASRRL